MARIPETTKNQRPLTSIPMQYLRKGDRFVAVIHAASGRVGQVVTGTADMDGSMVSEDRGFRADDYSDYGGYINVKFDDPVKPYHLYTANNSMYHEEGWVFFVDREVAARYRADVQYNNDLLRTREAEKRAKKIEADESAKSAKRANRKAELQRQVAELQRKIDELED